MQASLPKPLFDISQSTKSCCSLVSEEVLRGLTPEMIKFFAVCDVYWYWTTMRVYFDFHLREKYKHLSILDLIHYKPNLDLPVKQPKQDEQDSIEFIQSLLNLVMMRMKKNTIAKSLSKPIFSIGEINVCL